MIILFWTLMGFYMIKSGIKQIKHWRQIEKLACNYPYLERMKKMYETTYYDNLKHNGQNGQANQFEPNFESGLIEKVRYFVMRLQFIHPIYLPSLSE